MPLAPCPDQFPRRLLVIQDATKTLSSVPAARSMDVLTPREAESLFGFVEVGVAPAVGALRGVSSGPGTSHRKALFRKTGTRRQSDLVAPVGRGLALPFHDAPA
jgi:hypothetical protein